MRSPSARTPAGRTPAARTPLIGAAARRPCTLVVCRGCCCGNARKNPGTDHAWQLERLRAAAAEHGFQVRTSDCLGPCDQANVIVVQPSAAGRRAGGRAVWIGFATDDDSTEEVIAWAAAGGPGVAPPPVTLQLQFVSPRPQR
ncbi:MULTISPECIES: (2Fe-2S) ferredoxin domain-containing protein [Streptomyces]|uniref:(2Fe-2S) ferredoxin domain-containing protein n=1 Tax=Streptomyces griseosporeus TaxID=1910 RepID=A0ABV3KY49_STRGS|nr:(2Fe-2S) ferredoxin domain-containing protein [Streptomyces actuosus]